MPDYREIVRHFSEQDNKVTRELEKATRIASNSAFFERASKMASNPALKNAGRAAARSSLVANRASRIAARRAQKASEVFGKEVRRQYPLVNRRLSKITREMNLSAKHVSDSILEARASQAASKAVALAQKDLERSRRNVAKLPPPTSDEVEQWRKRRDERQRQEGEPGHEAS